MGNGVLIMVSKHNCGDLCAVDESFKQGTMMFFCSQLGACPYATHPCVSCLLGKDASGYRKVTAADIQTLIKISERS
jgi:hypothetical protein